MFFNLTLNAAAAMNHVILDFLVLVIRTEMWEDQGVKVSARDFGVGIDEDHKDRLFEPLFDILRFLVRYSIFTGLVAYAFSLLRGKDQKTVITGGNDGQVQGLFCTAGYPCSSWGPYLSGPGRQHHK
jgi:hypothetical protein